MDGLAANALRIGRVVTSVRYRSVGESLRSFHSSSPGGTFSFAGLQFYHLSISSTRRNVNGKCSNRKPCYQRQNLCAFSEPPSCHRSLLGHRGPITGPQTNLAFGSTGHAFAGAGMVISRQFGPTGGKPGTNGPTRPGSIRVSRASGTLGWLPARPPPVMAPTPSARLPASVMRPGYVPGTVGQNPFGTG